MRGKELLPEEKHNLIRVWIPQTIRVNYFLPVYIDTELTETAFDRLRLGGLFFV